MSTDYNPNDVNAVLSRMEQRQVDNQQLLTLALEKNDERWDDMQAWMKNHDVECGKREKRISKLENWRWYVIGVVVGGMVILGFFIKK